ncbi:MAG: N-acetylmuramoyl-L-alanine amidase [Oscillospiraceae bacterium]|nr:N-acetylmuramoyl-L-alanine amidase [Oscillospiraceae bacterium]
MKKIRYLSLLPVYAVILSGILGLVFLGNKVVTAVSTSAPIQNRKTVIIDAGHGGEDGGATSCTGVLESQINLEIALKLDDLMHLLGINTLMIRTTDCSIYTKGETIAQKKVSDLKERVRIVNETENGFLVSIHQNHFSNEKYSGAQVFYAPTDGSKDVAGVLQKSLIQTINPDSNRGIKKADSVYLMQHIDCPGILIECGFLSNHREEYLLRDVEYQRKLCSVIACTLSNHLFST